MPEVATKLTISPKRLQSARDISDMLVLWALCKHRACRKAGQCRVVPITCWDECMDLAPGPARDFVFALFDGKEYDLSFEDALAKVPEELGEEWCAWHEAVRKMTGRPSFKPQPGRRSLG
jgi:hypothetical protein